MDYIPYNNVIDTCDGLIEEIRELQDLHRELIRQTQSLVEVLRPNDPVAAV